MATLGIDVGNYNLHVASSNGNIVMPAMYTTKENLIDKGESIEINGVTYYLCSGSLEIKLNKVEKKSILPLIYAGIIKSTLDPVVNIIVGLPCSQYKMNKDVMKQNIISNKVINIKYKGVERTIVIENCEVFPEGAGSYYSLEDKPQNCIIVDIGGKTINMVQIEKGKVTNPNTKPLGMINLYSDIRDYLNSKYTLDLKIEQIEDVLKEGLWVEAEKVDMSFIKPIISDFINELMNELELKYPIRTQEVLLTGGGAFLLYGVLQRKITRIRRLENYLTANAEGFRKVGLNLWKEEEL
jgi:plasmid segregation protein ParM